MDQESLSPAKILLLASCLAGRADIGGLRKLAGAHKDYLGEDLLLRVLLTHLPETTMPQSYVGFLREIHVPEMPAVPVPDLELDDSSFRRMPEHHAVKEASNLHLLPLHCSETSCLGEDDPFGRFLILMACRMDAEAGMLRHVPELLVPFLNHSQALRTWILSTALPYVRRNTIYYAEATPAFSLCQFQDLPAQEATLYLLSRSAASQRSHGHLYRDLRGLLGPWLYNEEHWLEHAEEPRLDADTQTTRAEKCPGWERVLEWLVAQAMTSCGVLCDAIKQWGGPRDVEFGYEASLDLSEPRKQYLDRTYARAVLTVAYMVPEASYDFLTDLYQMCCKLRSLLAHSECDLPLPDVLFELPGLDISDGQLLWNSKAATFSRNDLLQPSNPLTSATHFSTTLLMALVLSALISSRIGVSWTLKRASDLAFLQDEKEQKVELGKLMRMILVSAKDDEQTWLRARRDLLWLHDWGCPSRASSTHVQPVLASVSKDCYTLASTIFESGTDRPLTPGKVQDAVFQSALNALHALPELASTSLPRSKQIQALLKATHALSDYQLVLKHGEPFSPVVLRLHPDPISIIHTALQQNGQAYTRLHEFLEMGNCIVDADLPTAPPSGCLDPCSLENCERRSFVAERRITAMCIEAALKEDDFETAYSYVVSRLGTTKGDANDRQHDDWSWQAALQAGQYVRTERTQRPTHLGTSSGNADIRHTEQRLECLAAALRIAPISRLQEILKSFRRCEEQLHSAAKEEATNEASWDATADLSTIPGTYDVMSATGAPLLPHDVTIRTTFRQVEEAPMSLFNLSKATAKIAQKNMPQLSSLPSIGISSLSMPLKFEQQTRKRDQLRDVATGTLVSGVGWLIGANVGNQYKGESD
ncbi:hypothetical protein CDD80_5528 [Ophiocordyceps camponoti-rufipedis]|uniref:Sec39 domain-containing protein n=1 Tax=Ophiocordyceps camponoti-rufipedis TaxID=2004952 RepID=A0A2C5YTY8_9HYPO|nr:hypothetical protein CDD80_5528 [Ophiocordyceps camponoti-rufipedis]